MKFPAFSQLAGKIPRVPGSLRVPAPGQPGHARCSALHETRAAGSRAIGAGTDHESRGRRCGPTGFADDRSG